MRIRPTRAGLVSACWLLCVCCGWTGVVCAQVTTAKERPAAALQAPDAVAQGASQTLNELRVAVEQARFQDAHVLAEQLLAQTLDARTRNDALELHAIALIAARKEAAAQASLAELFARDPEHPQRMRDPGPNVEAMFARVRAQGRPTVVVPELRLSARRDKRSTIYVRLDLGRDADAVETLHVFAPIRQGQGQPVVDPVHVEAIAGAREQLWLALPGLALPGHVIALYAEARAPSGAVLTRVGSQEKPLQITLDPDAGPVQDVPLRRTWWVWTSAAIVTAGVAIAVGVAAH